MHNWELKLKDYPQLCKQLKTKSLQQLKRDDVCHVLVTLRHTTSTGHMLITGLLQQHTGQFSRLVSPLQSEPNCSLSV